MSFSPVTSWQIDGETMETVVDFIFLGFQITADGDCSHEIKKCLLLWRKGITSLGGVLKSRHCQRSLYSQSYGFSSSRVWIWKLDYKESWAPSLKNWCFQTVVGAKSLESPLYCVEIKPFKPEGNQFWIFIGRTEAETPILWLPDVKSKIIGKDPDAWKDLKQKKGEAEGEMDR